MGVEDTSPDFYLLALEGITQQACRPCSVG